MPITFLPPVTTQLFLYIMRFTPPEPSHASTCLTIKNAFNVRIQLLLSAVFPPELSIMPSPSSSGAPHSSVCVAGYLDSIFIPLRPPPLLFFNKCLNMSPQSRCNYSVVAARVLWEGEGKTERGREGKEGGRDMHAKRGGWAGVFELNGRVRQIEGAL